MPLRARRGRLWLPVLLSLLLSLLLHHINTELTAFRIFGGVLNIRLFMEALYLLFPLLYLRFAHGFPQVVIVALWLDAMEPHNFGLRLTLYTLLLVLMLPVRVRIRRENPAHVARLAMVMNLLLFTALLGASLAGPVSFSGGLFWKALGDLAVSEAVIAASAFGWIEFQRRVIIWISREDPAAYSMV